MRPLGEERQVTERWSTKSKACSAQGPKTNFNLKDKETKEEEVVTVHRCVYKCAYGSMQDVTI